MKTLNIVWAKYSLFEVLDPLGYSNISNNSKQPPGPMHPPPSSQGGLHIEDTSLMKRPSPFPCQFGGV